MKSLYQITHPVGTQGEASAQASIQGSDLVLEAQIEFRQPVGVIVDKVTPPVYQLIDKLEALIPGDQKEIAARAKAELREQILKALTEPPAQVQA